MDLSDTEKEGTQPASGEGCRLCDQDWNSQDKDTWQGPGGLKS